MRKHRRTRHYRKITIAALAIGAVGVPTAAMACIGNDGDGPGRRHASQWDAAAASQVTPASKATPGATRTAAPAKAAATSTSAPASGDAAGVVRLVNKERGKAGCSPVTVNAKLTKAAQAHSEDMAEHRNMSHTGSDGSSPDDRITRAGYRWSSYGENVAYGYATPEKVMAGWMSSPGHKRNILDCSFKEIGIGLAQPGDYWTQDFGKTG
jgi:uncharacterized protein YkwD